MTLGAAISTVAQYCAVLFHISHLFMIQFDEIVNCVHLNQNIESLKLHPLIAENL